jgi:hypothetical protein
LIAVFEDGEEEKEHNHVNQLAAEDLAEITQKPAQKELPEKESINKLCSLGKDTLFPTKKFDLRWGPEVMMKSSIGKYLLMVNTSPKIHLMFRIVWTTCQPARIMSTDLNNLFFELFFPSVVEYVKMLVYERPVDATSDDNSRNVCC